jgi:hypothetical protein
LPYLPLVRDDGKGRDDLVKAIKIHRDQKERELKQLATMKDKNIFKSRNLYLAIHRLFESHSFPLETRKEVIKLFENTAKLKGAKFDRDRTFSATNSDLFTKFPSRICLDGVFESFHQHNLELHEVARDDNSLFSCISHQLFGDVRYHKFIRTQCIDFIVQHSSKFLLLMSEDLDKYVSKIRGGDCGNDIEIRALCAYFRRPIEMWECIDAKLGTIQKKPSFCDDIKSTRTPFRLFRTGSHYDSLIDDNAIRSFVKFQDITQNNTLKEDDAFQLAVLNSLMK